MDVLWQIEINITLFFQNLGTWLNLPMQAFTFLGNELFFLLIMPALFWCIDPVIGFRAGFMLVLSGSVNSWFKILFHSPRPFWMDGSVMAMSSETSFGLPSGHSQTAASIWGIVAATLKKKWAIIIAVIVIAMVGLSRIYLGVHFTRDVLSGWLIGGLLVVLYLKLEKPVTNWLKKKNLTEHLTISFAFSIALLGIGFLSRLAVSGWEMPETWVSQALASGAERPDPFNMEGIVTLAGVAFGFLGGYAWYLQKYNKYTVNCSLLKRIARYVLGLVGVLGLYLGLSYLFPDEPEIVGYLFRYLRYALIGVWVTAIGPLLFKILKLE